MSELTFIKEALDEIREHLRTINGRCMEHAQKIAALREGQNNIKKSMETNKIFIIRLAASVIAGVILAAIAYIFGKNA